jgi:hypothetical protein
MSKHNKLDEAANELLAKDCGYTNRIGGSGTDLFSLPNIKHISVPESGDVECFIMPIRTVTGAVLWEPSHTPYDKQEEWGGPDSASSYHRPNHVDDERLFSSGPNQEEQLIEMEEQEMIAD